MPSQSYDIFVSYCKRDADRVMRTVDFLDSCGYRIWIDHRNLHGGSVWHVAVTEGLQASKCLVLFITTCSMASKECGKEVSLASEDVGIPIIPVRIDDVDYGDQFKYHLKHVQYVDIILDQNLGHQRLLEALIALRIPPRSVIGASKAIRGAGGPRPRHLRRLAWIIPGLIAAITVIGLVHYSMHGIVNSDGDMNSASPPPPHRNIKDSSAGQGVSLPSVQSAAQATPEVPRALMKENAKLPPARPLGRIAVLYFDNNSSAEHGTLIPLAKGIANILILQLSEDDLYDVVERERLDAVLLEMDLSASGKVDSSTACKIGHLVGAQNLVLGSYFELMGSLRIDARIVSVETGVTVAAVGTSGTPDAFMKLIDEIGCRLVQRHRETAKIRAADPHPSAPAVGDYEIVLKIGQALDALDDRRTADARRLALMVLSKCPDNVIALKIVTQCDAPPTDAR